MTPVLELWFRGSNDVPHRSCPAFRTIPLTTPKPPWQAGSSRRSGPPRGEPAASGPPRGEPAASGPPRGEPAGTGGEHQAPLAVAPLLVELLVVLLDSAVHVHRAEPRPAHR